MRLLDVLALSVLMAACAASDDGGVAAGAPLGQATLELLKRQLATMGGMCGGIAGFQCTG